MSTKHTPMKQIGTTVRFNGGGFDVYKCPEAEKLASLIVKAVNSHEQLVAALKKIAAIENQMYGDDWQEIEEARDIANEALAAAGE